MLMNIYSPLSLVAESATMDSTLTLMLKEESITNTILRMETSVMKEYYASKKREWKTILESGDNQDIITEGIGSSIGDFFKSIIEAIKSMFNALFGKMKDKETSSKSADVEIDKNAKEIKTAIDSGVDPKAAALEKKKKAAEAKIEADKIAKNKAEAAKDEKLYRELDEAIKKANETLKEIKEDEAAFEKEHGKELNINKQFYVIDMFLKPYGTITSPLLSYIDSPVTGEVSREIIDDQCDKLAMEVYSNFFDNASSTEYNTFTKADMANPSLYFKNKYNLTAPNMPIYAKDLANNNTIYSRLVSDHKDSENRMNDINKDVDRMNDYLKKANSSYENATKYNQIDLANYSMHKILNLIKDVSREYVQCAAFAIRNRARNQQSVIKLQRQILGKTESADDKPVSESCIIHGEVVDADSIFDNGDDDFGHDEWLDLSLKEECKFETRIEEINAQRYLNECIILASEATHLEKIRSIRSITEAEAKQSKNIVSRAIDGIKRIFQKFLEKLRSIGKDNTKYLIKYKKVILESKPMAQKIKMKDCFTGIDRLTKAKIGQFNYDAIKGKMETPEAAQEWLKQQLPAVNDDALNGIKEFRTWCLAYFCVAPESPLKEFEMSDPAQINMTDVYNFMFDIKKIESQLSSDQKGLEETANSFATAAEKISHEVNPTQTAATSTSKPHIRLTQTEAMAWSVVYNKVLTEAVIHELEKVTDAKAAPAEDPARASSNVANSTEDAPDAEKSLKAANVAGSNEELQKVKLHTDNYTAAVRTFFTAKLTATEVIRGELMQLVRLHVKNFIKDDTQGTTGKAVGSNYSA